MRLIYLLMVFLFISCTNDSLDNSFIWKTPMNASIDRSLNDLSIESKLDLNEINLFYSLKLEIEGQNLFFQNGNELEIFVLNKEKIDLSEIQKISFIEGRGPGELLSINDYNVHTNKIYISDRQQGKVAIFDLEGGFIQEFRISDIIVDRLHIIDVDRILTFSMKTGENVFNIINTNGEVIESFVKTEADLHYLMYSGDVSYKEGELYFAGYSEPILKKYDLGEKSLSYSVNTVKSYTTEGNYITSEIGGFKSSRYTPAALYNSLAHTVYKDSLYMTRHHNGEIEGKFIDVYNSKTGEYTLSYKLEYYPRIYGIAADENYIYSLEQSKGNKEWLVVYKKN